MNSTEPAAISQPLFTSRTIALSVEDPDILAKIRADYLAQFRPTTAAELFQVETMVNSDWRLRRVWELESASIDYIIEAQAPELDERAPGIDNATRTAFAYSELTSETRVLDSYQRLENDLQRRWDRAHRNLMKLRDPKSSPSRLSRFPLARPLTTGNPPETEFCTSEPNNYDSAVEENINLAPDAIREVENCTSEPNEHPPAVEKYINPAAAAPTSAGGAHLGPSLQCPEPKRPNAGADPITAETHPSPVPESLLLARIPGDPPGPPASTQTGTSAPEPLYP